MPRPPQFGEPAPDFNSATTQNPKFSFGSAGGRNILLVFLGFPLTPAAKLLVAEAKALRANFDDEFACLFYVVSSAADVDQLGLKYDVPGVRYFMDYDRSVARLYGLASDSSSAVVEPMLFTIDRGLRILQAISVKERRPHMAPALALLRQASDARDALPALNHAPVLVIERIFEPALCSRLIDYYKRRGGVDSGTMREREGLTVPVIDHSFKRRFDCHIEDSEFAGQLVRRMFWRLKPQIQKAFQFEVTRVERHLIACYDAVAGGFFRAHRDNTTKGTAHRRFAVTINLNAGEYEGGDLRFPEFGSKTYRAPTGGAVVFSCSLLHEATPMTKGTRYAYLPFFYTDADADLRERNKAFLDKKSGGLVDTDSNP